MAQTGSAQREPSMEEILASIRRIIEDSDSVQPTSASESVSQLRGAGTYESFPEPSAPEPSASADVPHGGESSESDAGEIEAFRAELDEAPGKRLSPPSMAEIQASVTGSSVPEVEPEAPSAEIRPFRNEQPSLPDDAQVEPIMPENEVSKPEPSAFSAGVVDAQAPQDDALPSADLRPAIMSDRTERQVAASFNELSDAFAASRRRSFDEMAEEMLRPMLRDWLDNNLPTLVEKLVREEIERVARGG